MKHNLIGISGKIGSGKDTVGLMISYLAWKKTILDKGLIDESMLVDYKDFSGKYLAESQFQIKKFGGKLKEIAGLLIGCTEEDFEDREFKEKELGKEWWFYVSSLFPGGEMYPYINASEETHNNTGLYLIKLTPRKILQLLGTECGREIIHPNIWVNALFANYIARPKGKAHDLQDMSELYSGKTCDNCGITFSGYKRQPYCKKCTEDDSVQIYPNWIITDMRFPNELEAVKSRGGLTIRVNLIGNEDTGDHESETALDDASFDVTINAEFGLDKLLQKVNEQIIPLL